MLRAWFLAMTVLVLPLEPASAGAPSEPCENAALKYWQAFASLPRLTGAEEKKLNEECVTMPLDARAREIVTKADYALKMMRGGAALSRCEWDIGFEEGISTRLPHAEGARALASLACLRARIRFEEAREAEALDDIVAALTLGRHVSRDGYLVSILVRYAIEERMGQSLAIHLPDLNAMILKDLRTRLDALPHGGSTAAAVRDEEKCGLDWLVRMAKKVERRVKGGEDKEKVLASLPEDEDVREFVQKCGGTTAGVLKFAEEMRPWYALTAARWDRPLDEFGKEQEHEATKYTDNPVFRTFTPGIIKVRQAQARADVRRALLAAAIDLQLGGRDVLKDALKNHPDPVVGGPFEYQEFEGWIELRSTWKLGSRPLYRDDSPLALTVGRRGK
jgi:hypothetical protein